jgi:hypothetical protein
MSKKKRMKIYELIRQGNMQKYKLKSVECVDLLNCRESRTYFPTTKIALENYLGKYELIT